MKIKWQTTLILLFSLCILILGITAFTCYNNFKFLGTTRPAEWGSLGSFVGGMLTTITTFYLVFTFQTQNQQAKKDEIERRFFLMLDLYKSNVNEFKLNTLNINGKDVIDKIIEDFEKIFSDVKDFNERGFHTQAYTHPKSF